MLGVIGDLVEDVVVMLAGPPARGTDTTATIARTRGGSAANVAAAAASTGTAVCFIGRVGDDPAGSRLVDELVAGGVDARVQREGRTGAIVVLVEPDGERTMLSDRGAAVELDGLDPAWLDGVTWLHVPAYSLCAEPIGAAAHQAIAVVRAAGGRVSVDVSSVALVDGFGAARFAELLVELAPDVVLANAEEAMRLDGVPASWRLVVKCGADPVVVVEPDGARTEVAVAPVVAVRDTTGAGDAFAAGFLAAVLAGRDVVGAVADGSALAGRTLGTAGAGVDVLAP